MFTGIITHIGIVRNLEHSPKKDLLISLEISKENLERNLDLGCSISCSGICLTLVKKTNLEKNKIELEFQASDESINKTNIKSWKIGDKINVEFALRMGDELGGHLVLGHVDDVIKIKNIKKVNSDSWNFTLFFPQKFKKFIAPKGSVVLDGTSLTINEVFADSFNVNIIKHTFDHTNFSELKIGDEVNLEVDLIARYLSSMIDK